MSTICFIISRFDEVGGTSRVLSIISNELSYSKKYRILVIDFSPNERKSAFTIGGEIRYYSIKTTNVLKRVTAIRRLIKYENIKVLIGLESMMGLYVLPATFSTKCKSVIWEHGNFYYKQSRKIDFLRFIELKYCDAFIVLTSRDLESFKSNFNYKCILDYIYNPVTIPTTSSPYALESKKIISVGVVREIKGYHFLVEVAAKLKNYSTDWCWEIHGRTDYSEEYTNLIEKKILENNLQGHVVLKGNTTDIESIYKSSALLVLTSKNEGLPMVLLEAKTHNIPIVSFDIHTGPAEIIDNFINGNLIKFGDIDEMANKINRLLSDDKLRAQYSRNTQFGLSKFDVNNVVKKWIELIEEILDG